MEQARGPRRKPGRKSKGQRTPTMIYLPDEFRADAQEIAHRDDLPLTSVITRMVAEALGRPVPSYCQPRQQIDVQEKLPLPKVS